MLRTHFVSFGFALAMSAFSGLALADDCVATLDAPLDRPQSCVQDNITWATVTLTFDVVSQPNEYYFVTNVPANVENFVERVHVYGLRLNSQGQEEQVCYIEWPDTGRVGHCGATKPTYFRIYVNPQKP